MNDKNTYYNLSIEHFLEHNFKILNIYYSSIIINTFINSEI
jgi:hypothetical protein